MGIQEILDKFKPTCSRCYHLVALLVAVAVVYGLNNTVLVLTMHESQAESSVTQCRQSSVLYLGLICCCSASLLRMSPADD